jgi:hypothetical protein
MFRPGAWRTGFTAVGSWRARPRGVKTERSGEMVARPSSLFFVDWDQSGRRRAAVVLGGGEAPDYAGAVANPR